jgi:hypothetical protein
MSDIGSSAVRPVHCAGSELVLLVFEQDVERGERFVTARELPVKKAFGEGAERDTRGAYAPRNPPIIPNHDDLRRMSRARHGRHGDQDG